MSVSASRHSLRCDSTTQRPVGESPRDASEERMLRSRSSCGKHDGSVLIACTRDEMPQARCPRAALSRNLSAGARPGVGETLSRFTDHAARDNERVTSVGRPKCSRDTVALLVRGAGAGGWRRAAVAPVPVPGSSGYYPDRAIVRGVLYRSFYNRTDINNSHNMTARATARAARDRLIHIKRPRPPPPGRATDFRGLAAPRRRRRRRAREALCGTCDRTAPRTSFDRDRFSRSDSGRGGRDSELKEHHSA